MPSLTRLDRILWSQIIDPPATGGSGTVTSVDMTVPSILSVAGNPVTTSGTLAVSLANQSANRVLAGPTSGGAAAPTFRSLVAADLPGLRCYSLFFASTTAHNPTDAVTYYLGYVGQSTNTAADARRVYIPTTGTVVAAICTVNSVTAVGSNENWTINFRLNNTTSTAIATVGANTAYRVFRNDALSIAVSGGDYFEIESVSPTWATNPQGVTYQGHVVVAF